MAEVVVGLVASGVSIGTLAVQIATSIAKLKSFWDQVWEAPEEISLLIEEIEDLHLILDDISNDQSRNAMSSALLDNASASSCIQHCQRGYDRLRELVDDMAAEVNGRGGLRRKWASMKIYCHATKSRNISHD